MEMVLESASPCPDCLEHHNKELGTIKMETAKAKESRRLSGKT